MHSAAWQIRHYLTPDGGDPVADWLAGLADRVARARILARLGRLAGGGFGDCKPLTDGVWELRIDHGPGYRVLYAQAGWCCCWSVATSAHSGPTSARHCNAGRTGNADRIMATTDRTHDQAVVELLRQDPAFAADHIAAALEGADQPGGPVALLAALRQVAEARGVATVAKRAGLARESLYRALSSKGNPTLKTLNAALRGLGLRLTVKEAA